MKFLAILEDSFREAIASYVCMVQIALTVVFVLLLASLSFQPLDARMALQPLGPYLLEALRLEPLSEGRLSQVRLNPRDPFTIIAAQPLDGPESPSSSYRITVAVQCADVLAAEELIRSPETATTFLREHFGRLGSRRYFAVTDINLVTEPSQRVPPVAAWYDVTARPGPDLPLLWPYQIKAFFGLLSLDEGHHGIPLGTMLYEIENNVINVGAAWAVILLSIVVTAFLVPSMLRKGAIDLLLVRPLHRVRLLVYRYLSGVLYVFVTVGLMILALWLVLGLRSGVWKPGLLLSIPVITFFFAILYAVSVFNGVLTRSAVTAIMVTCIAWFGLWILGLVYAYFDQTRGIPSENDWAYPIVDTLHAVLPRTSDLDLLMRKVLTRELLDDVQARQMGANTLPAITWSESLTVSAAFIGVLLGVASWRFYRKDY
jgi:ABC-type transport system involved in multi-copper enzyme maturation permease subunit